MAQACVTVPLDTSGPSSVGRDEVFPPRMLGVCLEGHTWPVQVTWQPVTLEIGPQRPETPRIVQVPTEVTPRFCVECWLVDRRAEPYRGLRHLEAAPVTAPAAGEKR